MDSLAFAQSRFRWRNDDGSETAATWLELEDVDATPIVESDGTLVLRVRIGFEETNNTSSGPNISFNFERNVDGAGWATIPAAGAGSEPVRFFNSSNVTDGEDTTEQLTKTGGTTWEAGEIVESDPSENTPISGLDWSENEAVVEFVGAQMGGVTEIQFRLTQEGTPFGTYTVTPAIQATVAVVKTASGSTTGLGSKTTAAPHRIRQAGGSTLGQASTKTAAPVRVRLSQGHVSVGMFG